MVAFLNERSLEQYGDWTKSLGLFLAAAQKLMPTGSSLFKDSHFFFTPSIVQRFNTLSFAKDERALMRELVFGSRYYKCWRQQRVSTETEKYACVDPNLEFLDESVSEAAERELAQATRSVSLLSAPDSAFQNKVLITVSKLSSGDTIELRNASSVQSITQWITSERGYYDPNSQSAPHDFQTVLIKEPDRFRATGKFERGFQRGVFEEITTGRLYYVDHGHPGHCAHLEVFSENREHLGTADINSGELDTSGRVTGRVLRL